MAYQTCMISFSRSNKCLPAFLHFSTQEVFYDAGLYADLDFEVLQPFDGLMKGETLVLASMTDDLTFNHSIPNAWMASAPGHRFWQFCLHHIVASASPCLLQPTKG